MAIAVNLITMFLEYPVQGGFVAEWSKAILDSEGLSEMQRMQEVRDILLPLPREEDLA